MASKVAEEALLSDLSRIMKWNLGRYYWVTIDRRETASKKGKMGSNDPICPSSGSVVNWTLLLVPLRAEIILSFGVKTSAKNKEAFLRKICSKGGGIRAGYLCRLVGMNKKLRHFVFWFVAIRTYFLFPLNKSPGVNVPGKYNARAFYYIIHG